jgi:ABC-type Mn2+/Zn2+ transport system ATPase subunit
MEERERHRPGKLSGGEQQRVAIARTLANNPTLILADEPTGNLDSGTGALIIGLLQDLAHQGRRVVVVTHDHSVAAKADDQLELVDGRIISMKIAEKPRASGCLHSRRRRSTMCAPKSTTAAAILIAGLLVTAISPWAIPVAGAVGIMSSPTVPSLKSNGTSA